MLVDVEKVEQLIKKAVQDLGYELITVQVFKEEESYILQVVIDKPGLTVEDCVTATNVINPILDENENLFKETYILDVCSKGVEK